MIADAGLVSSSVSSRTSEIKTRRGRMQRFQLGRGPTQTSSASSYSLLTKTIITSDSAPKLEQKQHLRIASLCVTPVNSRMSCFPARRLNIAGLVRADEADWMWCAEEREVERGKELWGRMMIRGEMKAYLRASPHSAVASWPHGWYLLHFLSAVNFIFSAFLITRTCSCLNHCLLPSQLPFFCFNIFFIHHLSAFSII